MDLSIMADMAANLRDFTQQFHPYFSRREPRETFDGILLAMLLAPERKNGWELAQFAGKETPHSTHRFFTSTPWQADEVLHQYQRSMLETLGTKGALIFDETGFLKKGTASVGVKRQYSGTAGRTENCQVGVFAAYITAHVHILWDRRLFMPTEWIEDAQRRETAHVPTWVEHRTKSGLARDMFEHALTLGMTPSWVGGDPVYGDDTKLRDTIAAAGCDYVFAVAQTTKVWTEWPPTLTLEEREEQRTSNRGRRPIRDCLAKDAPARIKICDLAQEWDESSWVEWSAGDGSKGERTYKWAWCEVIEARDEALNEKMPSRRSLLLVRQKGDDPKTRAYYLCHSPTQEHSAQIWLARAATRWPIEQCFEEAKQEFGLDEYEVRRWEGWHRHITLSMLAHGFVACERARITAAEAKKKKRNKLVGSV